jgi:hypothetical protein
MRRVCLRGVNIPDPPHLVQAHQGALPAIKLGPGKRLIRVRRCDLEEFIAQGAMNDPSSNGGNL